jgi:hypothetical protein
MNTVPTLDEIADDPKSATCLPHEVIAGLLLKVAAVESALTTALIDPHNSVTAVPAPIDGDWLLVVEETAAKLGLTCDYLYRRKDRPFRVSVAAGQVRFCSGRCSGCRVIAIQLSKSMSRAGATGSRRTGPGPSAE